jgi:hypothetical protein
MDALIVVAASFGLICSVGFVVIRSSSENMRKVAAWLISAAQAKDELRRAKQGIEIERRIRQQDLESRLLPQRQSVEVDVIVEERT